MMAPTSSSTMFYFYTNELKFSPEFLGYLKLIYAIGSLFGVSMYHRFFKHVPFKKFFVSSTILCTLLGLT